MITVPGWAWATPLLVVLVAVDITDLIFAVDSIPASFGITTNVFIVFTANAFAVLGLRSLYFVLAGALHRFSYLRQGMTVLLGYIGGKMILAPVLHVPTVVSLAVIVVIIAGAAAASVGQNSRQTARTAPGARPDAPGGRPDVPGAPPVAPSARRSTA